MQSEAIVSAIARSPNRAICQGMPDSLAQRRSQRQRRLLMFDSSVAITGWQPPGVLRIKSYG
jgi:hypothetical protein